MIPILVNTVFKNIRKDILAGKFDSAAKLASERKLCEQYDVSRGTIRSAISLLEDEGLVRKYPRQGIVLVKDAIQKQTRHIKKATSITHIRSEKNYLQMGIARGILNWADQTGNQVTILEAASYEQYCELIQNSTNNSDGLILIPYQTEYYISAIKQATLNGTKIVFVDRYIPELNISSVTADNFSGAYELTSHLIQRHNLPVHYIGGKQLPTSVADRAKGWIAAMCAYGFIDTEEYLWELNESEYSMSMSSQDTWRHGYEKALSIFGNKEDKYCIFAQNDFTAVGVYRAVQQAGLSIGEDVFIVGFDGLPLAEKMKPSLTTALQPLEKIGYLAARKLTKMLEGKSLEVVHQTLPCQLMVNASS